MEMEVFGEFLNERGGLGGWEVKNSEGIDPIVKWWGEEESFVFEVLLDFVEVVFGTGADCCGHILEFLSLRA